MEKKNVCILGGSGGVAQSALLLLQNHRRFLGDLFLLDENDSVTANPYLDHTALRYTFIKQKLKYPQATDYIKQFIGDHRISVVIDLSYLDTLPTLTCVNDAGCSYINTSMNHTKLTAAEMLIELFERRVHFRNAAHVLISGMNPGVVNAWTGHAIRKHGKPLDLTLFEFDSSEPKGDWQPVVTWSAQEFVVEAIENRSGTMAGRNKIQWLLPNGISHQLPMKNILSPIVHLDSYPSGATILHEECVTLAHTYDIPTRFIYSLHPRTMEQLSHQDFNGRKQGTLQLARGDNTSIPLKGSDTIGILLTYRDKQVYYHNSLANESCTGTNATYVQVAVGLLAGLFTTLYDNLSPGLYFPEDLIESTYLPFILSNLHTEEHIVGDGQILSSSVLQHTRSVSPVLENIPLHLPISL